MTIPEREVVAKQIVGIMPALIRKIGADLRCAEPGPAVDPSHFRLLATLALNSHNLSELAERQGVSLATMSKTVATLAERGWVQRVPSMTDRRVVQVEMTPLGHQVWEGLHARMQQGVINLLDDMSGDDLKTLSDGLSILHGMLHLSPSACGDEAGVEVNFGGMHDRNS